MEVEGRTSISFASKVSQFSYLKPNIYQSPWIWTARSDLLSGRNGELNNDLRVYKEGGLLVLQGNLSDEKLARLTKSMSGGTWKAVALDHEVMVSFHLLNSLPTCNNRVWKYYSFDSRVAILNIPYDFLSSISGKKPNVALSNYHEQSLRIFINLAMIALTTDYKKDQVHLPEILKRLR